jgi:hypothetical protein
MPKSRSVASWGALGFAPIVVLGSSAALAQAPARPERPSDGPPPIVATTRPVGPSATRTLASPGGLKAVARSEGTPSPGLRVTLDGSASSGGRIWYRWLQTQGPKVAIDDPTRAEAHFVVPDEASVLGFVLVVGDASGVDARALTLEVEDPERDADNQALRADAGDEQSSKVGRKVVLNGVRSEPRGKIRFRWVQAGGPKATLRGGEGPTCSFVPSVPGTYQFALVVASSGGLMSEPSMLTVQVSGAPRAAVGSAEAPPMAIDELARSSIGSIEGGVRYAEDLSKAFDTVADRIDSFKSYNDATAEMTRRLDAIVPRDKDRRAIWVEQLFSPLMSQIVAGLKDEGLDLTQPEAPAKPMTRPQRARLTEQLRYAAAGLRAARTLR